MKLVLIITAILCGQQVMVQASNFCPVPTLKLKAGTFHIWNCKDGDESSFRVNLAVNTHDVCASGTFDITSPNVGKFTVELATRVTGTVMGFIRLDKPVKLCRTDPSKDSCPVEMTCKAIATYIGVQTTYSDGRCHLKVGQYSFKVSTNFKQDLSQYRTFQSMFSNGKIHLKVTVNDLSLGKTVGCMSEVIGVKVKK